VTTPAIYVDQTSLETFFPSMHVRDVFCDDGSGSPGPRLAVACSVASRMADAELLPAWGGETLEALVTTDDSILYCIAALAMAVGVQGRAAWSGPGSPYADLGSSSRKLLKDLAAGQRRSRSEETAGVNPNLARGVRSVVTPNFIFTPSAQRPKPGGF
jgi:hypothetical protein